MALAVRDTGTGIPAHELPHIFERFHRIRDARARTHEGTGIGLALVQELVRLHGGQITVASAVGVGTTFTVTIPTGTAHLPADRVGVARTLASTALGADAYLQEALRWLPGEPESQSDGQVPFPYAPASPLPSVPTRARILLADDNADMRAYVQRLLSPHWEMEAVADGAKALAVASERLPDLVLADVMMPGLDGFALLRALRADPRTATIPVLLLSARAGEEARVEGLEAGADDYLVKPFSARELLARVEAHLTLAQLRREAAEQVRHSAEELAAVVHHSPAAIWIAHDAECCRITGNAAAAALLGVEHTANVSQRVPGTVRRIYRRHGVALRLEELPLERAIATAQPVHEPELELVRPGGTSIYLMGAAVPLFDAHGVVRGAVATLVDCTERKRAEDTVRQRTAQFETLLNAAPLGVYLVDADFRIRQVNPTARLLFGNIPDLIGRDFDEVIHRLWSKEYADEIVRLFRHTLDTGEPYLTPERIEERRDRGVTEYYEWHIHRLPLPDGRYGVVCYFRDISAQVFARQAIAVSEARWRTMFDVTTVGFAVLTPTARFLQLNDAFCRLVGYAREELLELDADALTHPGDRATMRQQLDRLTAGAMPSCVIEQRYIRKDGALIWVQHSVSLTRDAAGSRCTSSSSVRRSPRSARPRRSQLASRRRWNWLSAVPHSMRYSTYWHAPPRHKPRTAPGRPFSSWMRRAPSSALALRRACLRGTRKPWMDSPLVRSRPPAVRQPIPGRRSLCVTWRRIRSGHRIWTWCGNTAFAPAGRSRSGHWEGQCWARSRCITAALASRSRAPASSSVCSPRPPPS